VEGVKWGGVEWCRVDATIQHKRCTYLEQVWREIMVERATPKNLD